MPRRSESSRGGWAMSWRRPRQRALGAGGARRGDPGAGAAPAAALTLVPPKPNVFFGVSDRGTTAEFNEFAELVAQAPGAAGDLPPLGQQPQRRPTNAGAKPARGRSCTSRPPTTRRWRELITPEQIALGGRRRLPAAAQRLLRQTRAARLHPAARRAEPLPQRLVGGQLRRQPEGRRTHDRLVQAGLPPDRRDRARRPDAWKGSTRPWRKSACRRSTAPRARTRPSCRRRR